jgi:hypothetical protein
MRLILSGTRRKRCSEFTKKVEVKEVLAWKSKDGKASYVKLEVIPLEYAKWVMGKKRWVLTKC